MKLKQIVVAASCALGASSIAHAQTSSVQLYGRAVLGIDNYEAEGARNATATGAACTAGAPGCTSGSALDFKSRFRVFDVGSRVGLRGSEDLGNGLKAIFQIETGVNIDSGSNTGQGGQPNVSSGFFASRDSFVGLDSNFGRLTFGRQSTYWTNGVNAQFVANYINGEIPWTNGTMLGRVSRGAGAAGPIARYSNNLQYVTPSFAGVDAVLSYSPNNQEAVQNNATVDTDGYMWGATLRGTWGPFYAQVDYANQKAGDPKAAGAQRAEWAGWKVGGSWGYMPGARIGLIWVRTETNGALGNVLGDDVHQQGWTINWEHTFGNVQVLAQYGQTGSMKGCDATAIISCSNTKSTGYMVGARYFLSRRTWLFASYNLVDNESNNFADYTAFANTSVAAGAGVTAGVPFGADPQIIAVGIFHNF
jgi:predicted porin